MTPLRLLVLLVSLPLLLGGCGEEVSTNKTKPVEERLQEIKEEVKTEEPVTETKPELEGVNAKKIEVREGIRYRKGSDAPYTGKVFNLYKSGKKESEANYKDGKSDGLVVKWHRNGQKEAEINFKDGKENGLWTRWHNNGQKKQEIYFKDGKEDGLWIEWDKNGQKSSEANYKNGKVHGLAVIWHQNGQKKSERNWKEGKMIYEKFWNSKGEPVDTYEEGLK